MEVILKQDVTGVGKAGAVIKVRDGFAQNFLLRKKLAVAVTSGNVKMLEQEKQRRLLKEEKDKAAAEELKVKLAGMSITLPVLTQEKEKLYGSITVVEIQKALADEGCVIDKEAFVMEEPIKALGIYQIPVKLHAEVTGQIKVWIVKK